MEGPFLKDSFIWDDWGPLPAVAWMGLGLGGLLAVAVWRKNKEGSAPGNDPTAPTGDIAGRVPGNQTAPYVFVTDIGPFQFPKQDPTPITVTIPEAPPGGGRTEPPAQPPPPAQPVPPAPQAPAAPVRSGQTVTVAKYTSKNPPWNSTLWGIAQRILGNGNLWGNVWNAPENAALRARRGGDYHKIQAGDQIFVPK
jgi:nucleoid-associated protein YgaU